MHSTVNAKSMMRPIAKVKYSKISQHPMIIQSLIYNYSIVKWQSVSKSMCSGRWDLQSFLINQQIGMCKCEHRTATYRFSNRTNTIANYESICIDAIVCNEYEQWNDAKVNEKLQFTIKGINTTITARLCASTSRIRNDSMARRWWWGNWEGKRINAIYALSHDTNWSTRQTTTFVRYCHYRLWA